MLKLYFSLKTETKTCYRFEAKDNETFVTLYLKKKQVKDADIDPQKGIVVTIEQKED